MVTTFYLAIGLGFALGATDEKKPDLLRMILIAAFWPACLAFLIGLKLSE